MIELVPHQVVNRCSYYFALEEYVMQHFPKQDYFLLWNIGPSVIIGRHQLLETEVNLDFITQQSIELYRRPSGGGAVYADQGCNMFSFFSPNFNKEMVFPTYLGLMTEALKKFNINAEFSGRNDLLVHGRKFSGNAFYRLNDRAVLHGTLLFDTKIETMVRALTPSNDKLISKGIASVRERVINLCHLVSLSQADFFQQLVANLCDSHYYLTEEDEREIHRLEAKYLDPQWIYGHNPPFDVLRTGRSAAGSLDIRFSVNHARVTACKVQGDFFALQPIEAWEQYFVGIPFTEEAIVAVLEAHPIELWIQQATTAEISAMMRGKLL